MTLKDQVRTKRIRYLLDADGGVLEPGSSDALTVVPWDYDGTVENGLSAGYCNFLDEEFEKTGGRYPPYLSQSDTAREYKEGQIDPRGAGWARNLTDQFERRLRERFQIIELDNPDSYEWKFVDIALTMAQLVYGFLVLAKNPLLMEAHVAARYLRHPAICGAIVERNGEVTPEKMGVLRRQAGVPNMPVWFVAHHAVGYAWAMEMAAQITHGKFQYMSVTHSVRGEYAVSEDILKPNLGV